MNKNITPIFKRDTLFQCECGSNQFHIIVRNDLFIRCAECEVRIEDSRNQWSVYLAEIEKRINDEQAYNALPATQHLPGCAANYPGWSCDKDCKD